MLLQKCCNNIKSKDTVIRKYFNYTSVISILLPPPTVFLIPFSIQSPYSSIIFNLLKHVYFKNFNKINKPTKAKTHNNVITVYKITHPKDKPLLIKYTDVVVDPQHLMNVKCKIILNNIGKPIQIFANLDIKIFKGDCLIMYNDILLFKLSLEQELLACLINLLILMGLKKFLIKINFVN